MLQFPSPHRLKCKKVEILSIILYKVHTVLSSQIATKFWNGLAWSGSDCHWIIASIWFWCGNISFCSICWSHCIKSLKIQSQPTNVIRTFVDGVRQSIGLSILTWIPWILDVGVILADGSWAWIIDDKNTTNTKTKWKIDDLKLFENIKNAFTLQHSHPWMSLP